MLTNFTRHFCETFHCFRRSTPAHRPKKNHGLAPGAFLSMTKRSHKHRLTGIRCFRRPTACVLYCPASPAIDRCKLTMEKPQKLRTSTPGDREASKQLIQAQSTTNNNISNYGRPRKHARGRRAMKLNPAKCACYPRSAWRDVAKDARCETSACDTYSTLHSEAPCIVKHEFIQDTSAPLKVCGTSINGTATISPWSTRRSV